MHFNLEQHTGETIAFADELGQQVSYGALHSAIDSLGASLGARCLALCLCRNTAGSAVGYLAMLENGIVPLLASAALPAFAVQGLVDAYRPALVWQPKDLEPPNGSKRETAYLDYVLYRTAQEPCPLHNDLEMCMPTSGSTGSPKLVRHKKGNLQANAVAVAKAFGFGSDERTLADLGMNYTMGLNVINAHLAAGATVVLSTSNIMTKQHWNLYENERITNITGVPFTFDVLSKLGFFERKLPHLKTVAQGGGRMPEDRFEQLAEYAQRSGKQFVATYGATETSARMTLLPPDLAAAKTCSIGKPLAHGSVSLLDDAGKDILQAGEVGELVYFGPNVAMGYAASWQDLADGDEWQGCYCTGDLACFDDDGCYYIKGRRSRFLKILGHRIDLDECERILFREHNANCACTGTDEVLVAYVEAPADAHACRETLKKALRLRPSQVEAVELDKIPRNDGGKILYSRLPDAL